jgi:hypothetical protein
MPRFYAHIAPGARRHFQVRFTTKEIIMDTALLIQAASNIAGSMAATQYGKFGGMEASRIADIAVIAVKIARAIEVEAIKQL